MRPIRDEEWCLLDATLRLIAEYGAIGGKTVFKPSDEPNGQAQLHHLSAHALGYSHAPLLRIRLTPEEDAQLRKLETNPLAPLKVRRRAQACGWPPWDGPPPGSPATWAWTAPPSSGTSGGGWKREQTAQDGKPPDARPRWTPEMSAFLRKLLKGRGLDGPAVLPTGKARKEVERFRKALEEAQKGLRVFFLDESGFGLSFPPHYAWARRSGRRGGWRWPAWEPGGGSGPGDGGAQEASGRRDVARSMRGHLAEAVGA